MTKLPLARSAEHLIDGLPPPTKVPNVVEELPAPPEPGEPVLEAPSEIAAGTSSSSEEEPRIHKRVTLAARRRAQEMNVDLAGVEGTGQDGQINGSRPAQQSPAEAILTRCQHPLRRCWVSLQTPPSDYH